MEKILRIDVSNKEDFYEKYNQKTVSKNLINYIIEDAMFISNNDQIKVVINDKCNLEKDCLRLIKGGLEIEYKKNLNNRHINNIKQFFLLLTGILFLFLSTTIKGNIFKEVFLIIGWVPIWEVIDIELFTDIKERRKRKVLKKLLESSFEIINN